MDSDTPAVDVQLRNAVRADVPTIVALLADDPLGAKREAFGEPLPDVYWQAFDAIDTDANNALIVAEIDGAVVGVLQLTFIPNMTYQGGIRAQIEGVRIASNRRAEGIGAAMIRWALRCAAMRGCHLVQLTTDKRRPESIRFYEQLGFAATHEGMKRVTDKRAL